MVLIKTLNKLKMEISEGIQTSNQQIKLITI